MFSNDNSEQVDQFQWKIEAYVAADWLCRLYYDCKLWDKRILVLGDPRLSLVQDKMYI